ncbi:MAG: DNA primase [Candidatus Lokiarchaeota archaeon]|nr:DNA primase [Candidatus Lokiarchaeota archaeon]
MGAGDFDSSTAKYVIRAKIEVDGVVDKPDVVGAVFGQTEGLLGEDLDLRELQRTGRIGRIQIAIRSQGGNSTGEIVIPVSLNKTATAILAASLETVDRVGPCTAKITLEKLEDIRGAKRRKVVSRAISILKGWEEDIAPGAEEIKGAVTRASKKSVTKYGSEKLPAGPDLSSSDEIIIVEGRADIITLMKSGINNTIAVEGTHVPKTIMELTKKKGKTIIAFLDGDRGGDLILRELMQVAQVDYIARAPKGKEVEDLTRHEITKALQAKIPAEQALALVKGRSSKQKQTRKSTRSKSRESKRDKPSRRKEPRSRERKTTTRTSTVDAVFLEKVKEIKETFQAVLYSEEQKIIDQCGVADLAQTLERTNDVTTVVFDGVVTQRLVDIAAEKKIETLIAAAVVDLDNKPRGVKIITFEDVK